MLIQLQYVGLLRLGRLFYPGNTIPPKRDFRGDRGHAPPPPFWRVGDTISNAPYVVGTRVRVIGHSRVHSAYAISLDFIFPDINWFVLIINPSWKRNVSNFECDHDTLAWMPAYATTVLLNLSLKITLKNLMYWKSHDNHTFFIQECKNR